MPTDNYEDLLDVLVNLPELSVIIFVHSGRFTYVAIKVRGTWYTSATEINKSIELTMSSEDLAYALITDACQMMQLAMNWQDI